MLRTVLLFLFFSCIYSSECHGSGNDSLLYNSRVLALRDSLLNQGIDTMLIFHTKYNGNIAGAMPGTDYILWQKFGQTNCIVTDKLNRRDNMPGNPIIFSNYFKVKELIETEKLRNSRGGDHVNYLILLFIINTNIKTYVIPSYLLYRNEGNEGSAIVDYVETILPLLKP